MNRVSSIFSQMLKLVPAPLFQRAVDEHRDERHSRGFRSWDQFVAMLFCQLGQAMSLREIEEGLLAAEGKNVTADKAIVFGQHATANNENFFRVVHFGDEASRREFQFLTSHHELPAETIAAIYKERWRVELPFEALKQNLRIKSFVGTSANALKTQIWTALIALLLVRYLQLRSKMAWHLSRFIALLRQQLFVYRDLWLLLDRPFEGPPGANEEEESPPPLLALLFQAVTDPQPQPESGPTDALQSTMAGVPVVGCG